MVVPLRLKQVGPQNMEYANKTHCKDADTHVLVLELASETVITSSPWYKGKLHRELDYFERKAMQY